ncbi:hypothetical protein [Microbacterium terregens]|uniref:Uncharacterized protein n=1 Tax=Microbacterium terregens TaxID=69363 RepID=A0ABV5SZL6_9MICO
MEDDDVLGVGVGVGDPERVAVGADDVIGVPGSGTHAESSSTTDASAIARGIDSCHMG